MKTPGATHYSFGWVAFIKEDGVTIMTISNRIFDTEAQAVTHAQQTIEKGEHI